MKIPAEEEEAIPQTSQPSPRVQSLWRYPVKSMAGEELGSAQIITRGLLGDRFYALVDTRRKVGTARKLKGILKCSARFIREPQADQPAPPIEITVPDGGRVSREQPDSAAILSKVFEHEVKLHSTSTEGLTFEFAAGTLGGSRYLPPHRGQQEPNQSHRALARRSAQPRAARCANRPY